MRIKTNLGSLEAQKYAKEHAKELESTSAKLSSGDRITKASDDAAGLSIASKIEALQRSRKQAIRNGNDAVSVVQVAEGGLVELGNMVQRLRELAVQAASDTYSDEERGLLDLEVQQLIKEVDRIAVSTEYNGRKLFTPKEDGEKFTVHVGASAGKDNSIDVDWDDMAQDSYALGIFDVDVKNQLHARLSIMKLDNAIDEISKSRAKVGAFQKRFEHAINNLENSVQYQEMALSVITNVDVALETSKRASAATLLDSAAAVLSQANTSPNSALKLLK
jgi:flagellin